MKVGEAIANENWDLKEEINIACIEAKQAGMWISISKPVYSSFIALDRMTNYYLILSKDVYCDLAPLLQMPGTFRVCIASKTIELLRLKS